MHWLAVILRDKSIRPFAVALLLAAALAPILIGLTTLSQAQGLPSSPGHPPRANVATPHHGTDTTLSPAPISEPVEPSTPAVPAPKPAPVEPEAPAPEATTAPAAEAPAEPTGPESVEVGFYAINIYNLNIAANTFNADVYVWFAWTGPLDPTASFELNNGVDTSNLTKIADYVEPEKLPDGRFYQVFRVESRFFQPFDLSRFPFDKHDLSIVIEDKDNVTEKLVYRPDLWQSGLDESVAIPGWQITHWLVAADAHHYRSNFGDPRDGTDGSTYSQARFEISIQRPLNYFLFKLFLPMLIVLLLPWGALLVPPTKVEPRTALAATGLLTAVFLQLGYATGLPDTGYLTLLDKIYLLTYFLIVAVLFETLLTARWVHGAKESPESIARARRLDHRMLAFEVLAFAAGVAWLLWKK